MPPNQKFSQQSVIVTTAHKLLVKYRVNTIYFVPHLPAVETVLLGQSRKDTGLVINQAYFALLQQYII